MKRSLAIWPAVGSLVAFLALSLAPGAGAATLEFTGTLEFQFVEAPYYHPSITIPGAGSVGVNTTGVLHLDSFALSAGAFGPISTSVPLTYGGDATALRFTGIQNLSGSFSAMSGGPAGGGPMGLQGLVKICLFVDPSCQSAFVAVPLTPTTGGAGVGIGGTHSIAGPINLTYQNAPWTIGQPLLTLHAPSTTVTTPAVPGGFAHGPASLTSSTAQPSGALQLVTVSKIFTSLTGVEPEWLTVAVIRLHFAPEPGTLLLLGCGVAVFALVARLRGRQ